MPPRNSRGRPAGGRGAAQTATEGSAPTIARPAVTGTLRLGLADRVDGFGVLDLDGWRPLVPAGVRVVVDLGAARRLTPGARQALAAATVAAREVDVIGDDPVGVSDAVAAVSGALRAVDSDRWPYNGPVSSRRWSA